jgi:hypothetical protein
MNLTNGQQALTGNDALAIFRNIFRQDGGRLTAIVNQLTAQNAGEKSTAKVQDFTGAKSEDPVKWLNAFERATITNRWNTKPRKCQVAGGYMKGAVADWFDGIRALINNNWNTGTNAGNNFYDLFNQQFVNETRKNQWYQELTMLRQKSDESVDTYANKFKKLAARVGMTDVQQQKRMFHMRLNPAYTPLVYSQNSNDLKAAITAARTVEVGYNFAAGTSKPITSTVTATIATPKVNAIAQAMIDPAPVTTNEVDELTKKIEQLSINYANLTAALMAQMTNASSSTSRRPDNTIGLCATQL